MSTPHLKGNDYPNVIIPANIGWETDDTGNKVPVSGEFDDVYFSHADGLAESRHVFIEGNQLPIRLASLLPHQCFTIAELGFGTGLNLLAVWQLWQQLRAAQSTPTQARLHFITTEMHPIPLADLTDILALWAQRAPELSDNITQLLAVYPSLIEGCHRLHFDNDNLIVDIWLGDAATSLAKLAQPYTDKKPHVDAWFLDGFAPSCNESLWADTLFQQLQRLSNEGTTAATYSCAGVVKRALTANGFRIKKVKGFGRKREMLTAIMSKPSSLESHLALSSDSDTSLDNGTSLDSAIIENHLLEAPTETASDKSNHHTDHNIVIGAGVSGLMTAWSLAKRGIKVTLVDKRAPLSGASGNPRALLAPKMTPLHHVAEHLHTMGYLYSSRLYFQLNTQAEHLNHQDNSRHLAPIIEPTGALDLLLKANIDSTQIADYPDDMAMTLSAVEARSATGLTMQDLTENLYLPQSGLVNPQALKDIILSHPLIDFKPLEVTQIAESKYQVSVSGHIYEQQSLSTITLKADNVVICAAFESHQLDERIFDCRKIRGQLSWFTPTHEQLARLPKSPLKYGGYCTLFTPKTGDAQLNTVVEAQPQFLLGASFVRNDIETDIRADEHLVSRDKLIKAIPELDAIIPTETQHWQARVGIRTQTPDYHPIVGPLAASKRLWVMSAMGAKGYAYAPLCAEALVAMMVGGFSPLSASMLAQLSPSRSRLQTPLAP